MKKNKPMRAAGILLLATMLTTCMTAGTFAKYTTSDSASDTARVAKFGVVVSADGTLFGKQYADGNNTTTNANEIITYDSTSTEGTVQVISTGNYNIVAPGTKNETGLGFSITGTPEVDVEITSEIKTENIYLKAGTYGVMVKENSVTDVNFDGTKLFVLSDDGTYSHPNSYNTTETYYTIKNETTLDEDYYPVVYKLKGGTNGTNDVDGTFTTDSLAEIAKTIKTKLDIAENETTGTKTIQANTNLINELRLDSEVLTWEWAYERLPIEIYDNADTILGDLSAFNSDDSTFMGTVVSLNDSGVTYTALDKDDTDDNYNLKTKFDISITVTQID